MKAEAGATDCHCHVFGDAATYPLHPGRGYTPLPGLDLEAYVRMAGALGLQRRVLVQPTPYGIDHRCMMDAMAKLDGEQTRGVAVIDRSFNAATLEAMHDLGFRAARINAVNANGTPLEQLRDVVKLIAPLGWHLELYLPPEQMVALGPGLVDLPVPVVIDHMGNAPAQNRLEQPSFKMLLRLLDSGRCWVKLCPYRVSTVGWPYPDVMEGFRKLVEAAPGRCVWGSDWPHVAQESGMQPNDNELLQQLRQWMPEPNIRRRILVDNPTELYGFAG